MEIPAYEDFYPYILKLLEDKQIYQLKDAREDLADKLPSTLLIIK